METIAVVVDSILHHKKDGATGWVVLTFPMGKNSMTTYGSNCEMRKIVDVLCEAADSLEHRLADARKAIEVDDTL